MKKLLLLLIISIGLVSIYFNYGPSDEKAIDTALAEEEQAAILDAELAKFEAELVTKLALQKEEVEMERQAALDAFQQKLAADKAAAARSTAAYQDSLLEEELAAFEARLEVELAAQEMMAEIETEMQRQVALDAFQQKLAADKAAAAKSTAAYQSKRVNDARVAALMADLASQEMMVEIKSEMARQIALDSFLKKLADDKASAAASTAAYQATLASDGVDLFLKKLIEIFIR
jgi:colicin import membrane protein